MTPMLLLTALLTALTYVVNAVYRQESAVVRLERGLRTYLTQGR
jgi:hypothetical protein